MYCDCHIHTLFSSDGHEHARDMIEAAIEKKLSLVCITDHADPAHPEGIYGVTKAVLPDYIKTLAALKKEYAKKIDVRIGLEIGYLPEGESAACELAKSGLEYVINSVHCVGSTDIYNPIFFAGKTRREAVTGYLEAVLASLDAPYPFTALGHLGYIERILPYDDKHIRVAEFDGLFSAIFKKLIEKGVILEVNTSTGKSGEPSLPTPEILKAYYDAGGRKITLGSDSHFHRSIARGFDEAVVMLKKIGFKALTTPLKEFAI